MGELGTWLRETREAQDLSLEEVEAQTRIRRAFLQALEEGDYNALPGEVYVRGFLRNYALYLGLDPEEVRRRYSQEVLSQGLQQSAQGGGFRLIDAALVPPSRPISALVMRAVLVLLLLVGATGVGAWYWYGCPLPQVPAWWPPQIAVPPLTMIPLRNPPTSMPPVPASTPIPLLVIPSATMMLTSSPPTMTPTPSPPAVTPTSGVVATSAVLPLPTPAPVRTATPTPTPTSLPAPSESQGIQLTARVIERAWVLVTVDGEAGSEGILEAGEERTWWAEHSISFRCGNAGGVMITINGEELGTLGERGQVVDQTWVVSEEQISVVTPSSP
jgi:cytoskeleton protein RodZ